MAEASGDLDRLNGPLRIGYEHGLTWATEPSGPGSQMSLGTKCGRPRGIVLLAVVWEVAL